MKILKTLINNISLVKKTNSIRTHGVQSKGGINGLIQSLRINGLDGENHLKPNKDDISDWFEG